jgi:ABC-type uncharacterized transport system ATPase component
MRFKQAITLGSRYIQRESGNTIFDVVKYQPSHLDEEDILADDWSPVFHEQVVYFKKKESK